MLKWDGKVKLSLKNSREENIKERSRNNKKNKNIRIFRSRNKKKK